MMNIKSGAEDEVCEALAQNPTVEEVAVIYGEYDAIYPQGKIREHEDTRQIHHRDPQSTTKHIPDSYNAHRQAIQIAFIFPIPH